MIFLVTANSFFTEEGCSATQYKLSVFQRQQLGESKNDCWCAYEVRCEGVHFVGIFQEGKGCCLVGYTWLPTKWNRESWRVIVTVAKSPRETESVTVEDEQADEWKLGQSA